MPSTRNNRTILVLVVVLAFSLAILAALAFAITAVTASMRQAAAAQSLASVPGTYVESTSRGWIIVMGPLTTDVDLIPVEHVGEIDQLVLRGPVTDKGIATVAKNQHIRALSLRGVRNPLLTDAIGTSIARITGLQVVDVTDTLLGDKFLAHIVGMPNLSSLDASGSTVTDAGAKVLAKTRALKSVRLPAATVSEQATRELRAALRCEVILTQ